AMREQVRRDPPPAYATARPDRPLTRLPTGGGADAPWPQADLVSTLMGRRSVRRFAPEGLALGELAALLQVAGGILEVRDGLGTGPAVFKTSPAAGAWHPIELHVHARRVDGLEPGVYHYAPTRGGLEPAPAPAAEVDPLDALGGQPWLAEAPVLILFTGVIERSAWRYATARAYRDMLIGLGHVSQTTLLTATAMGLGSVFATAVCDEDLERLAGVDPVEEVLLGVTAVGRPAPGA
ncbi:MAG TPA: SagB/ThcOx family dehydrogenase, partial [Solirubrobacteraceae bacterium]|nr:SagB/ThcOx family dehydrogenase [Solirubrobacteraceae bacterium]